ncbi:YabP/YqfC family sporulation protein [uncultured Clostridium sp.]|uniref:YabP/YqfC family sporulation protein n=1 Tax=uncultured Clostridium sp. TaxID=59620 RepID=UPI0026136832|nr:YabP/YqfC family sporulation protein [uncultured Clostridium sp.]
MDNFNRAKELLVENPKVEVRGNKEVLVENHKGIIILTDTLVRIKTKIGILNIHGSKFNLLFMEGATIVIAGEFVSLDYEGAV